MTIGPLQLVLVKFDREDRTRPVSDEIKSVRKSGVIRMVDLLYVYKDLNGILHEKEVSDLAESQKSEYGLILRGLLGMRAAYKTAGDVDKITEAMSLSPGDFGMTSEQVQRIADNLPNGGLAILVLLEHIWAVKLKQAMLNAGGELLAQGMLSPETLVLGGASLEDAMASAQKIEADAEQAAAAKAAEAEQAAAEQAAEADRKLAEAAVVVAAITAESDQKLAEAKAAADAKLAEAQRILDDAEAQAAQRLEQAKIVAAAAIAASVRTAAEDMQQAEKSKQEAEALREQSRLESEALRDESKRDAAATVALGAKLASGEVQAGRRTAQETIEQGVQTAEEIKAAAVTEALRILVEADLVKREATRQAISMLASAALIEQAAADEYFGPFLASNSSGMG